jgi:hypothetical protein
MLRRTLIAALPALLAAETARAAEAKKSQDVGQYVDLSPVAIPIVADGRLVNYVFVSVRILLTSSANAGKWRSREPFFRDALVRAAHRTPFTSSESYVVVDAERLKATMKREAIAIAGPKEVASVAILSQAPKRSTGLPTPRGRTRPAEIRP